MDEKALRKASREDLLELLIESTKEMERMRSEMEAMRQEVSQAREKMQEYTVTVQESGSIADAAAQITGLFAAAQKTADIYLSNMKRRQDEQEEECRRRQAESERAASEMIASAEKKCAQMEQETNKRCEELYRAAQEDAGRNWNDVLRRLTEIGEKDAHIEQLLEERPKRRWKL